MGPVVAEPIRTRADLDRLPELTPKHVPYITEAVGLLTAELGATPLIGFAGAPFTLASYLVEGGPSKNHEHTKALMYGDPELWHDLCARLAQIAGAFLDVQAAAGASAVQLFDSWVGALPLADYQRFVAPHSTAALAAVSGRGIPMIHFGVGTGELLAAWALSAPTSWGSTTACPSPMRWPGSTAGMPCRATSTPRCSSRRGRRWRPRSRAIVEEGRAAPGHIFNLGHGVLPDTDPDVLTRVVELVHEVGQR